MHEHLRRPMDGLEPSDDRARPEPTLDADPSAAQQAGDLRAANSPAGAALATRIEALLDRGLPDADALVALLEGSPTEACRAVAADPALVDRVVQACPLERLPAVLAALVEDPKWALYHYACRRGGRDPEAARALLTGATLAQQLEIVRWAELVGRLGELAGGHPDSLFGAAVSARVDAELAGGADPDRYGAFLEWRDGAGVDPAATLADMARSPEALAAALAGRRPRWRRFVAHSPRGAALGETERQRLDRVALAGRGLDAEALRAAFAVRFGLTLDAPGLGVDDVRGVWARLAPLDPSRIDRHVVERACLDPGGGLEGWRVSAFAHDTPRSEPQPPAKDDERQDDQADARSDRAAVDRAAVLDAFMEACGGDAALRVAAEALLAGRSDPAAWQAAVADADRRGVLRVPAAEALAALLRLSGEAHRPLRVDAPIGPPTVANAPDAGRRPGALPGWVERLRGDAPD